MGLDKDDIRQLIAILQKGLVDTSEQNEAVEDEEASVNMVVEKKSKRQKQQKSNGSKKDTGRNNLFDKMPEFRMHKEDVEIDRKLAKHPRTERSRKFTPISVKCRVCGREESVNPILVESKERYKCNKCARSSG